MTAQDRESGKVVSLKHSRDSDAETVQSPIALKKMLKSADKLPFGEKVGEWISKSTSDYENGEDTQMAKKSSISVSHAFANENDADEDWWDSLFVQNLKEQERCSDSDYESNPSSCERQENRMKHVWYRYTLDQNNIQIEPLSTEIRDRKIDDLISLILNGEDGDNEKIKHDLEKSKYLQSLPHKLSGQDVRETATMAVSAENKSAKSHGSYHLGTRAFIKTWDHPNALAISGMNVWTIRYLPERGLCANTPSIPKVFRQFSYSPKCSMKTTKNGSTGF